MNVRAHTNTCDSGVTNPWTGLRCCCCFRRRKWSNLSVYLIGTRPSSSYEASRESHGLTCTCKSPPPVANSNPPLPSFNLFVPGRGPGVHNIGISTRGPLPVRIKFEHSCKKFVRRGWPTGKRSRLPSSWVTCYNRAWFCLLMTLVREHGVSRWPCDV